jgi:hypothetical protein
MPGEPGPGAGENSSTSTAPNRSAIAANPEASEFGSVMSAANPAASMSSAPSVEARPSSLDWLRASSATAKP